MSLPASLRPAVTLLALLLAATGCSSAGSDGGGSDGGTGDRVVKVEGANISVSAPVVQPGPRPAAADQAASMVRINFPDDRGGQKATVQRRTDAGAWQTVATVTLSKSGAASYAGAPSAGVGAGAKPYQYRALTPAASGGQITTGRASAKGWQLRFDEEFDGDSLDTDVWSYRQEGLYSPVSDRACSASSPEAVTVGGGVLTLSARVDEARAQAMGACDDEDGNHHVDRDWYVNAHIGTHEDGHFRFKYGYAAARMKFPSERGAHGSFWMKSAKRSKLGEGADKDGAEIDVVEYFGDAFAKWKKPQSVYSFVYYRQPDGKQVKIPADDEPRQAITRKEAGLAPGDSWSSNYHVFSLLWGPKGYTFYVDGVRTQKITDGVSGVREYLVLSLLSSGWEAEHFPEDESLDATVDWVRVWQHKSQTCTGAPACGPGASPSAG